MTTLTAAGRAAGAEATGMAGTRCTAAARAGAGVEDDSEAAMATRAIDATTANARAAAMNFDMVASFVRVRRSGGGGGGVPPFPGRAGGPKSCAQPRGLAA